MIKKIIEFWFKSKCILCGEKEWCFKMVEDAFWQSHKTCEYKPGQKVYIE